MFYSYTGTSFNRFQELLSLGTRPTAHRWASRETYKDGTLTIEVDMPGFKKDDLDIEAADYTLTLKGTSQTKGRYLLSYNLSRSLDTTKIEALLDSGVLTLTIPQAAESQPKKIDVKVADSLGLS